MSNIDLFVCDNCDHVDSALITPVENNRHLCHQCKEGTWHHMFQYERYDPSVHHSVINRINTQYGDLGESSFG